jgi:hypothetical protein
VKFAAGVNVKTPEALNTYVPTFGTEMVAPEATVQLFGVCAGVVVGLHSRNDAGKSVAPAPAVSFASKLAEVAVL